MAVFAAPTVILLQIICARRAARKPEEVVKRYKEVLKTFKNVRTMSTAFNRHGVDRGTIASTASIAELAIADPVFYQEIKKNI
ncbi:Coiled-coil domain-containing protein 106 [Anabarilius grahami]|uniref:Coiled-coil domain-containing protein 106 n=1 Tax=Anabarilius grahami TaxID=495550 RepID=A0A3N0XT65_ANAGA|nr:Coiled-coil domain-containing protein 106 [Anabarilius grahami]